MSTKTWVFLDENKIQWGLYDEDLANEKNRAKMMKWCASLKKDTEEYFAKFYISSNGDGSNNNR